MTNQGVEIILKRMDSNPEEFHMFDDYSAAGKWGWLLYPLPLINARYSDVVSLLVVKDLVNGRQVLTR